MQIPVRRLTLFVGFLGLAAGPLQGQQVRVGLSAFAGAYLPTNDLFDSVRLRPDTSSLIIFNLGQEPGLLVGGRLTVRFSRLSVEAEAGYAFASLDIPNAVVQAGANNDASVFLGSVNALYDVIRAAFSPLSIYLSGGLGIVARGGDFLDQFSGTTSLSLALGGGFRYGLSRTTFLRVDIRDYVSSFTPTARSGFEFDSKTQNDLIGTIGLEISLSPTQ
ncbi:MAG: hypothetical protein AMS21_12590 [Gemmatimonas sp. SG8_38_2]|nr:MAG: hypothetical protein AMS21_12590 [Gemmatimonas sp. SG8_38_2]